MPVGGTNKRNDHGLQRKMEGKNMCAQVFSELLSGTNLISFCTTDLSPNELSLNKALALLHSMKSILEQEGRNLEGEQVQQNPTGGMCVEPCISLTMGLFSLLHLSGVATKCLT